MARSPIRSHSSWCASNEAWRSASQLSRRRLECDALRQILVLDPTKSPKHVQAELRKLDLSGNLKRPVIVMHGTSDTIVSPGESEGSRALVAKRVGAKNAATVLAVYYIPDMGHGGAEYDNLIGAQIDALEQWIDYRESGGTRGASAPESLGGYHRATSAPAKPD